MQLRQMQRRLSLKNATPMGKYQSRQSNPNYFFLTTNSFLGNNLFYICMAKKNLPQKVLLRRTQESPRPHICGIVVAYAYLPGLDPSWGLFDGLRTDRRKGAN